MVSPTIKLNSGHEMPLVGFGLWKVDNATAADTVYNAIKAGYRLFDGACGESVLVYRTTSRNGRAALDTWWLERSKRKSPYEEAGETTPPPHLTQLAARVQGTEPLDPHHILLHVSTRRLIS